MDEESDVYNYDRSFFFTLLDSRKFQSKFKLVQDQLGLVICPLEVSVHSRNPSNHQDLIDRHLFLPSLYLKNHYIPLSFNSTNLNPTIYLILDDAKNPNILVFKNGQRTCEYLKLLNIEESYNDLNRIYKILIVNKELHFNESSDKIETDFYENGLGHRRVSSFPNNDQTLLKLNNLSEVSTFGQSIDFMHNTMCLVSDFDIVGERKVSRIYKKCIGDDFLEEIELFKKTYIILETHLEECSKNLFKIYTKYVHLFIKSYNLELKFKSSFIDSNSQQVDLVILIACEISIIGCLFAKVWPCILKLNIEQDDVLNEKIQKLRFKLKVDEFKKNKKSYELYKEYFQLNEEYFRIDFKVIVKEINKIALLNNPFERLQCIKVTIDLLSNEMTVLSLKQQEDKVSSYVITSEILIPLLSFIMLLSSINCFKSIIYFIDKFNFSSQINESGLIEKVSGHKSHSLTYLDELNYFMTTFKAAVKFIEDS